MQTVEELSIIIAVLHTGDIKCYFPSSRRVGALSGLWSQRNQAGDNFIQKAVTV